MIDPLLGQARLRFVFSFYSVVGLLVVAPQDAE